MSSAPTLDGCQHGWKLDCHSVFVYNDDFCLTDLGLLRDLVLGEVDPLDGAERSEQLL